MTNTDRSVFGRNSLRTIFQQKPNYLLLLINRDCFGMLVLTRKRKKLQRPNIYKNKNLTSQSNLAVSLSMINATIGKSNS